MRVRKNRSDRTCRHNYHRTKTTGPVFRLFYMNPIPAKTMTIKLTTIIVLVLAGLQSLAAQPSTYQELKAQYQKQNYVACYRMATERGAGGLIFRALSLYRLPENHSLRKELDRPLIHMMDLMKKANNRLSQEAILDSDFLASEITDFQKTVFDEASRLYHRGSRNRAEAYFDAMHQTFDNSSPVFHNHYGFDGTHFVETLRSNIIQEKENRKYYRQEIRKLIDRHYRNNEDFKQWDNPKYRMAHTARSEDYLKREEKMIYYYLNLVRMNPELFLNTFIYARLHVKYHGEIQIRIPLYDTLTVSDYDTPLTQQEFFDLPVHKIYIDEVPNNGANRYIQKQMIGKSARSEKYRYDINYSGLYRYLQKNHPELLILKNLDKFSYTESGKGRILFRLYDKKITYYNRTFSEETKNNYYYQSLFGKLQSMRPQNIIDPDKQLFRTAECWAVEAGQRGLKGHDRITCHTNYHAEACDYGNKNGFDVVLNLLVDKFVPSLGHRKVLLGDFSEMGAAIRPHNSDLEYNAVLDFKR